MTDGQIITTAALCVLAWCLSTWATLAFLIWREDCRWRRWWTTGRSK